MQLPNDTVIALINSQRDLDIVLRENWYRIPVDKRAVPSIVRNQTVRFIAFYLSSVFGAQKWSVICYAAITEIKIVKRKYLLPPPVEPEEKEAFERKANLDYYRIRFLPPIFLSPPVMSRKGRRIIFITTNLERLLSAKEINEVFNGNFAEEALSQLLQRAAIPAEREYLVRIKRKSFFLDFAVFCRRGNINIECDGDYHFEKAALLLDKYRNNLLQSKGWTVLRFSTEDILYHASHSLSVIREAVLTYGGTTPKEV